MVGCKVVGSDPPRSLVAVVPQDNFRMLDNWGDVLGMRGSGSNSATVEDAFVPAHWTAESCTMDRTIGSTGTRVHGNPMYLGRFGTATVGLIAAAMVGTARAALDEYEEILRTKRLDNPFDPGTPLLMYQTVENQRNLGQAIMMVEHAQELLVRAGEKYMELCQRWAHEHIPFTQEDDLHQVHLVNTVCRVAVDAVELMFSTCRTLPARNGQRMQRYWQAANYLTIGQIYLQDNALLREPLRSEHIKPRLLGHWGTSFRRAGPGRDAVETPHPGNGSVVELLLLLLDVVEVTLDARPPVESGDMGGTVEPGMRA